MLDACTAAFAAALPLQQPADATLSAFFRSHPKIGRRDRATIADSVYAALRRRRLLERVAAAQNPRRLALATWIALLGASLRELEPWLRGDESEWLASVKRDAAAPQPFEVECELPDWAIERLSARYDESALLALAKGLRQSAQLDLGVNPLNVSREAALRQDRPCARRCTLQRTRYGAAQSRHEVAADARRCRGARGEAEIDSRRWRAPREAGRTARLRHLQYPGGRKPRRRRGFSAQ